MASPRSDAVALEGAEHEPTGEMVAFEAARHHAVGDRLERGGEVVRQIHLALRRGNGVHGERLRLHAAFHDIFPAQVGAAPRFDTALNTTIYLLRGLAMTRILRADPAEEDRVIALCVSLLKGESPSDGGG